MQYKDKFGEFSNYLMSEYIEHYKDCSSIKNYKQLARMLEYQLYAFRLGFTSEDLKRFLQIFDT